MQSASAKTATTNRKLSAGSCKSILIVQCCKTLSAVGPRLHKVGSRHTVLSVCWLDILQSNIVYGSGVLTNRVHVQESYCFQVKPVAIIQWQGNIHTHTHTHTGCRGPIYSASTYTHTQHTGMYPCAHLFRGFYTVMQCNLKTPPLLRDCPAFLKVCRLSKHSFTWKHSDCNWYAASASHLH